MPKQSTLFPQKEMPILQELTLAEAQNIAYQVKFSVEQHCENIEVAGSIRRQRPTVHDVDFVVVSKCDFEWLRISEELKRLKAKPSCQGNAVIKMLLPYKDGLFQIDFYRAQSETFGVHLLIRTGSAAHNMWLAGYAASLGMRLKYSQGLIKDETAIAGANEEGVFSVLGLPCPAPSEREIVDDRPIWQRQNTKESC